MSRRLLLLGLLAFLGVAAGCVTVNCCPPSGAPGPGPGGGPEPASPWPPVPPSALDAGTYDILQSVAGTTPWLVGRIWVKEDDTPGVTGRHIQHWIVGGPGGAPPFGEYNEHQTDTTFKSCFQASAGYHYAQDEYDLYLGNEWWGKTNRLYTRVVSQDMNDPPGSPY